MIQKYLLQSIFLTAKFHMIAYKNGLYQGQLTGHGKDGLGIFWWPCGAVYIGEWLNDSIQGEGLIFSENQVLRAQFKNNKIHGLCINHTTGEYLKYEYGYLHGTCIKGSQILRFKRGELLESYEDQQEAEIHLDEFSTRLLSFEEIIHRNQCNFIGMVENYLGCVRANQPFGLGVLNIFESERKIGIFEGFQLTQMGQIFSNNDIYTGGLKDDKYDQLGIYWIESQQKIIQGMFQSGKCVTILSSKSATLEHYKIQSQITYCKLIGAYQEMRVPQPFYQPVNTETMLVQSKAGFSTKREQSDISGRFETSCSQYEIDIKKELDQLYKIFTPESDDFGSPPLQQISNTLVGKDKDSSDRIKEQIEDLQTFRGVPLPDQKSPPSYSYSNTENEENPSAPQNKAMPSYSIQNSSQARSVFFHLESKNSMTFMEKNSSTGNGSQCSESKPKAPPRLESPKTIPKLLPLKSQPYSQTINNARKRSFYTQLILPE